MIDWVQVRQHYSIAEMISKYTGTPVRRDAVSRIRCPLHGSDNPTTMVVDDRRGLFFCFACHLGGSVIDLVAAMEQLSEKEAARKLAEGLDPHQIKTNEVRWNARETERRVALLQEEPLPEVPAPAGVLPIWTETPRHLSMDTCKAFGLGWLGGGAIYLPVHDRYGRLVGYSIRNPEGVQPKYKNSPGLDKSRVLYGLFQTASDIVKAHTAIIVEGQFDALSLWDKGYRNVVAAMGSNLSSDQVKLLLPLADRLLIMFDGDVAGREGALKLKQRWESAFAIELIDMPDDTDPASVGDLTMLEEKNERHAALDQRG